MKTRLGLLEEGGAPERPIFPALSDPHWNPQWMKWNTLQGPSCAPALNANGEKKIYTEQNQRIRVPGPVVESVTSCTWGFYGGGKV